MKKYQQLMLNFSQASLRSFLGNQIAEMLIEWSPNGGKELTKKELVAMIDCICGNSIFKNAQFRKQLLLCMSHDDIISIRDNCLSSNERRETNLHRIVDIIANRSWGKNKISRYLVDLWGLSDDIFDVKRTDDKPVCVISNKGENFYELLDYQYIIKQRALFILNSENSQERLFIHMPTGTGKTKTSMHIIVNYIQFTLKKNGLVLWIAHTNELLQQAYDTFVNVWGHLGDGDCIAYRLWGSNNIKDTDSQLNGIVFCGLAKLMSIFEGNPELTKRLKKDCRLIVFDEAHKAAADKTKTIIESLMLMPNGYSDRALIGLSATPGRTTESSYNNNLLSNMFGNKLINIDTDLLNQINMGKLQALNTIAEENIIRYFQERRILSRIVVEKLTYKTEFSDREIKILSKEIEDMGFGDGDFSSAQLKIFAENKHRNKEIMKKLRVLHRDKIPTIVFTCSVTHARMLSAMLTLEEIDNSLVVGDMSPVDRREAIDRFKDRNSKTNIIINYEVLTTGFDSKNIRCVFITRPTKSVVLYSQMLGRGLRGPMMGGNEECLLVDIEDNLQMFDNESAFSHFNDYWR